MKFEPITGREMQLEGFQQVVHTPDFAVSMDELMEETVDSVRKKLDDVFRNEHGHKIVRVYHQNGNSSFLVNAGFEKNMYNDVTDYVRKVMDRGVFPITFRFDNFLSFSPLRDVNSDTHE